MKNGLYKVSFQVLLKNHVDEDEAHESIMGMIQEMLERYEFPEVNFVLLEEHEVEYDDEEIDELDFEEVV